MEVDGRTFIGMVGLEVNASTDTVTMTLVGSTTEPPIQGTYGQIVIPTQMARTLREDGWDFVLVLDDDATYNEATEATVNTPERNGYSAMELTLKSQPDGLFVGSVRLENRFGDSATMELYGRLTAACTVGGGTSVDIVADPSTYEICDDIMGAL